MSEHHIGPIDDFPEGKGTEVTVNGISIAVFNVGGTLKAVHNNCPHKQLPLHLAGHSEYGVKRGAVEEENCSIQCPWHNLEFNLDTGHNPVLDQRIPTYEVDVRDGGQVYLNL